MRQHHRRRPFNMPSSVLDQLLLFSAPLERLPRSSDFRAPANWKSLQKLRAKFPLPAAAVKDCAIWSRNESRPIQIF
jgi:hypothetical protein